MFTRENFKAETLARRLDMYEPKNILDVGPSMGHQAKFWCDRGAKVTGVDLKERAPAVDGHPNYTHVCQDFMSALLGYEYYDAVWASHILEHVRNPGQFLRKMRNHCKQGGWICVVVPTDKQDEFKKEHLTLWTPAHLIYNMVCSGINCRKAQWYTFEQDIGLIVPKDDVAVPWSTDLRDLEPYLPVPFKHKMNAWLENHWYE